MRKHSAFVLVLCSDGENHYDLMCKKMLSFCIIELGSTLAKCVTNLKRKEI